jgi:putative ABC transport system substrate-binding protein
MRRPFMREAEDAVRALGVRLQTLTADSPEELGAAFAEMRTARAGAPTVLASTTSFVERGRVADLAARNRLPAMYHSTQHVDAGGLMSHGPNITDLLRRAGAHVGKLLEGAKPGDLPMEQSTKFELVINLKTANARGLTIPPSVLARADEVIR